MTLKGFGKMEPALEVPSRGGRAGLFSNRGARSSPGEVQRAKTSWGNCQALRGNSRRPMGMSCWRHCGCSLPINGRLPLLIVLLFISSSARALERAGLRDIEMRKGATGEGSGRNLHRTSMHVRMYVYVCIYVNVSCSSDW